MDSDLILKEVGHFGLYQVYVMSLLFLGGVYTTFYSVAYVFTAGDLDYRCRIKQCDGNSSLDDENRWLHFAIPFRDDQPSRCYRFRSTNNSTFHNETCSEDQFLQNVTERCNSFVYYTNETTIVNDFHLNCDENNWKRAAVGTANNIGQFIGLPLGGFISDRYGRKSLLVIASVLSCIMGLCRSFAVSYEMFITFEVLDAIVSSGCYSVTFIIGIEMFAQNNRVLGSAIISSFYSIGEVILGLAAWYLENWRLLLRVIYSPGILFISFIWLFPESIRWLVTNQKYEKTKQIVESISRVNKIQLSQELRKQLDSLGDDKRGQNNIKNERRERRPSVIEKHKGILKEIITSKVMVFRTITCSFSWMINAFVFYGLSLSSVSVAGNKYFNFILVSLAEIPGYVANYFILDRLGRRLSLFLALTASGSSCLAFHFVPEEMVVLKLILFLFGKTAITLSFSVLYVFSSEIFPTNARHSLMGTCSMFGRIGSMMAPLSILVVQYIDPTFIFGTAALVAGFLGLSFPETLNKHLPDTVKEAELLGKEQKLIEISDSSAS